MTKSSVESHCTRPVVGCLTFISLTPCDLGVRSSVAGFLQVSIFHSLYLHSRVVEIFRTSFCENFVFFDLPFKFSLAHWFVIFSFIFRGCRASLATHHEPLCCEKLGTLSGENHQVAVWTGEGGF
jgi:hypothetical protein